MAVGEYDPDSDAEPDFSCAAYVFAFWRLCQQHTTTDRGLGAEGSAMDAGRGQPNRQRSLNDVRVIDLRRRAPTAGAVLGTVACSIGSRCACTRSSSTTPA